jgi:hypothetical protein
LQARQAAVERTAVPRRTQSVFRNEAAEVPKKRAPSEAPIGNPMERRSKKSEGMMKKLRSLKRARVKSTVEKERQKRQTASAPGDASRSGSRAAGGLPLSLPRVLDFMSGGCYGCRPALARRLCPALEWCRLVQFAAAWCKIEGMQSDKTERKAVRQSVSLPSSLARQVAELAHSKRTSSNKVLLNLIERGMESLRAERERFFALADRLVKTKDLEEQKRIKEELARLTFGE